MQLGIYRHFKGDFYKIINVAVHSETEEIFVIYHKVDKPEKLWIRPISMFDKVVGHNNKEIERFEFISNE